MNVKHCDIYPEIYENVKTVYFDGGIDNMGEGYQWQIDLSPKAFYEVLKDYIQFIDEEELTWVNKKNLNTMAEKYNFSSDNEDENVISVPYFLNGTKTITKIWISQWQFLYEYAEYCQFIYRSYAKEIGRKFYQMNKHWVGGYGL